MGCWCEGALNGTCDAAHGVQEMLLPAGEQLDAMVRG
jgi:hypothetical protein